MLKRPLYVRYDKELVCVEDESWQTADQEHEHNGEEDELLPGRGRRQRHLVVAVQVVEVGRGLIRGGETVLSPPQCPR